MLNSGIEWSQESEFKTLLDSGQEIPKNVKFPREIYEKYQNYNRMKQVGGLKLVGSPTNSDVSHYTEKQLSKRMV